MGSYHDTVVIVSDSGDVWGGEGCCKAGAPALCISDMFLVAFCEVSHGEEVEEDMGAVPGTDLNARYEEYGCVPSLGLDDAGNSVVVGDGKPDALLFCKRERIAYSGGGVRVIGMKVHIHTDKTPLVERCDIGFTEDDSGKSILVTHGIQIPYLLPVLLLTCGVLVPVKWDKQQMRDFGQVFS